MRTCPNCGEELPEKFKICGYCGTRLEDPPAAPEVRKVVTVVFSDLAGSTALGERLDSESLRAVMDRYFAGMQRALQAHGGTIEKFIGDAVMAVFGLPTLHEDDALRAVRAAAAMVAELGALNDELEARYGVRLVNRTGVNTGEVVAGDPTAGQRLVTGDAVNVAARLEQAAPPGGVLLGALTHRLVRDAVESEPVEPLELKGKSQRVPAYRLIGLAAEAHERSAAPLVGRGAELAALEAALEEARRERQCRMQLIVGGAGFGKSSLVEAFVGAAAPGARVLRGRAPSYGRGITFWPLTELIRQAAGIGEADPPETQLARVDALLGSDSGTVRPRLAVAMGLSAEPFPLEELFWAARRLFEHLAADHPVVALFEDLHWAELSFLRLLQYLTNSMDAPVLLVGTGRPEVIDLEPELAEGPRRTMLGLEPLSASHTEEIVAGLTGGVPVQADVLEAIVAGADGNPLFAEQMLSMLFDDGRLVLGTGGWRTTGRFTRIEAPPSIQALLAARLDQLEPDDRSILEAASVIGTEFETAAARMLVGPGLAGAVDRRLAQLATKQLVLSVASSPGSPPAYRFEHAMIRESAYGRLLKRRRAELHEGYVRWAEDEQASRPGVDELDEVLGYHLEQAHRYLRELGPLDAHGRELGQHAAELLGAAGRRAFMREDMPAAANLLRRAALSLEHEDPARAPLLLLLAEALMDTGEFAAAQVQCEELMGSSDLVVAGTARVLHLLVRANASEGAHWTERIAGEAQGVLPALEAAQDHERLASVWRWTAWAHGTAGHYANAAQAAQAAMVAAGEAGDNRQQRRASAVYAVAALFGPTPVSEAIDRCADILSDEGCDRRTRGLVGNLLARLHAMEGDVDRARRLYVEAQGALGVLGADVVAASTSLETAAVEILAGDLVAAERELRRDLGTLEAMGETYLRSTVAGELARVLVEQDRDEEAWDANRTAESLAGEDDVVSQAIWRLGRARLLARSGERESACTLAEEGVRLLQDTDDHVDRADALVDLMVVLIQGDRLDEADAALDEALRLYTVKGNRVAARRAVALREAADETAVTAHAAHTRMRPL